jgi:hypothetical protein
VEWHSTAEGLPGTPRSLDQAMQWMLSTHNPRWSELSKEWRPIRDRRASVPNYALEVGLSTDTRMIMLGGQIKHWLY